VVPKTLITKFENKTPLKYNLTIIAFALLIGCFAALFPSSSLLLSVVAILAFILLIYAFPKPEVLFLCLIFFLPFTGIGIFEVGVKVTLSKIFAALICLSLVSKRFFGEKFAFRKTAYDKFLLSFFIVTVIITLLKAPFVPVNEISALDVGDLRSPQVRFITQIFNLALMISIYFLTLIILKDKKMIVRSINVLFLSTFLVAMYGLYQFIGGFLPLPFTYLTQIRLGQAAPGIHGFIGIARINSTLAEPKHLAFFLIPVILFLLYLLWKKVKPWANSPRFYCLLPLLVFIFLLTFSRSAWVLLGLSFIILLPFLLKQVRLVRFLKISLLICLGLLLVIGSVHWLTGLSIKAALEHRLAYISYDIWKASIDYPKIRAALDEFSKHPLLGVGYGNFPFYLASSEWYTSSHINISPNQFLMLLVETGILGFSLFICFVLGSLKSSLRMIKQTKVRFWRGVNTAFLFAIVGILVSLQYESQLNQPYFWFYLGMLNASVRLGLKEQPVSTSDIGRSLCE